MSAKNRNNQIEIDFFTEKEAGVLEKLFESNPCYDIKFYKKSTGHTMIVTDKIAENVYSESKEIVNKDTEEFKDSLIFSLFGDLVRLNNSLNFKL